MKQIRILLARLFIVTALGRAKERRSREHACGANRPLS
jgi:hypothetical protein